MAWHNSGNWEGLRVDRCGTLLYQLIKATAERRTLIGSNCTQYKYTVASGSEKYASEIALESEFYGMTYHQLIFSNIPILRDNINAILNDNSLGLSYPTMTGAVNTSTYPNGVFFNYDNSTLGQPVTLQDTTVTDSRIWTNIKDTLDSMVYVKWRLYDYDSTFTLNEAVGPDGTPHDSGAQAWEDAVDDPDSTSTTIRPRIGWYTTWTYTTGINSLTWQCFDTQSDSITLKTARVKGSLTKGVISWMAFPRHMDTLATPGNTFTWSGDNGTLSITCESDTYSAPTTADNATDYTDEVTTNDLGTGWPASIGSTDIDLSWTGPGLVGTDDPPVWPVEANHGSARGLSCWTYLEMIFGENYTRVETDITSELTYG